MVQPTEHVDRLDAVLHHANGTIEHALQMRRDLTRLIVQHLTLRPAANGNEELIEAHAGVDCDGTVEVVGDLTLLQGTGSVVADQLLLTSNTAA